jgi:hypothetical protein
MRIELEPVSWPVISTFRTAVHRLTEVATVQARVFGHTLIGRGEALGVLSVDTPRG